MIGWTYLRFLAQSLIKKKTIWIFGTLYIFFTAVLLVIVPAILSMSPWELWHNIALAPQTILLYVGSIFGALISITIFKDYQDDGTELILLSKPINRSKITIIKFFLFFAFSFFFTLISLVIAPLTFLLKDVSSNEVSGLVVSMLFSNLIILIIFGMFATLISLFANKIWTILANVVIIVLLSILSTVNALVIKSPAGLAIDDNHAIISTRYLAKDNEEHSFAALTPNYNLSADNPYIDFLNLSDEKKAWEGYQHKTKSNLTNYFDAIGQFNLLNNMGGLNNSATKDAGNSFGHNRFFDYQLEQEIINQTDDVLPYYFVSIPANVSSLKFDFGNIEQSLMTVLNRYVNLITDENIVMLGDSNAQTSSLISSLTPSKFKVAKGHNGIAGGMNNLLYYTPNDLAVNDLQKEVFDIVLGAIFDGGTKTLDVRTYNFGDELDAAQNYLNNPQAPGPDEDKYWDSLWHPEIVPDCSDVWISQDSSYSKVLTEADLERCESSNSIYNFIHMTLVGANNGSTNLDGEPLSDKNGIFEDVFWDHNVSPEIANEKLMKTMAMFKLYIFKEMTKKINSRIYKAANNTPLSTEFFPGLNFTSQPVLPLIINDDDQYNMGMINIPDTDISIPAGILMTICPMIQAQIGVEIPPEYNWANGSETGQQVSYFTDDQILRARAILQWISSEWEVGYSNATLSGLEEDTDDDELSLALNRDFNYDANLVTTSTNFPLIYEQLGATYSTTAKFQDYQLVLLWTTFAIVLTMIAFTVYIRTDFK